jgi:hypothetical protein
MRDGDLCQGVSYGYVLDDSCYSRDTVGSGILCFPWHRLANTSTACGCRNRSSLSAFDWKKCRDWKKIAFTQCNLAERYTKPSFYLLVLGFR